MKRYLWLSLFAVAMAYLETTVVVYLRELYYPDGFQFPLILGPVRIAVIEIAREAATVVMLLGVAVLAGRDRLGSFLTFCFLFGVWDIFYYVWLKITLGWPASLLAWDILFLIPLPWVGPVLAPVLVSVGLVGSSLVLLGIRARGVPVVIPRWAWILEIVAGAVVLASFLLNARLVLNEGVPDHFNWPIYGMGMALGLATFVLLVGRLRGLAASPGRA